MNLSIKALLPVEEVPEEVKEEKKGKKRAPKEEEAEEELREWHDDIDSSVSIADMIKNAENN